MNKDIISIRDNKDKSKISISEITENNKNKLCIVVLSNNALESAVTSINLKNAIRIRDKLNLWIKQQNS